MEIGGYLVVGLGDVWGDVDIPMYDDGCKQH
jgi:hypothetical protein